MFADSGTARMPQMIGAVGTAAAILSVASGRTWPQARSAGQTRRRNACNRLVEKTGRERCLIDANMSCEDYRRQVDGARKDFDPRAGRTITPK
jgi:hypothetical protein